MAFPLIPVVTAATALGNLFSNSSANRQREEALSRYRKRLIEAQYDPVEKAKALDRVGDLFNTEISNAMNASAFGFGRFANANTARAVSSAKLLGQRSGAIVNEGRRIDQFNKGIDLQLAESELQEPISDPLGDIISGGAAGLQLGLTAEDFLSQDRLTNQLIKNLKRFKPGKKTTTLGQTLLDLSSNPPGLFIR